jgi:hypothetical protein
MAFPYSRFVAALDSGGDQTLHAELGFFTSGGTDAKAGGTRYSGLAVVWRRLGRFARREVSAGMELTAAGDRSHWGTVISVNDTDPEFSVEVVRVGSAS